jgi:hypothetical protein
MGTWISSGTCAGLRGEEISLVGLHGTAESVARFVEKESIDPHFKLVTLGRTQGVQEDGHKFAIPCVKETQGAHLRPGIWLERSIEAKEELGQTHGKLFKRNLRKAKLHEFKKDFCRLIKRIQDAANLIPPEIDVYNECGLPRTMR